MSEGRSFFPPPIGGKKETEQRCESLDASRAELSAALAAVNAAYANLPPDLQVRIEVRRDGLDREIDAAFAAGDVERARAAVRAWRGWWLAAIERAGDG